MSQSFFPPILVVRLFAAPIRPVRVFADFSNFFLVEYAHSPRLGAAAIIVSSPSCRALHDYAQGVVPYHSIPYLWRYPRVAEVDEFRLGLLSVHLDVREGEIELGVPVLIRPAGSLSPRQRIHQSTTRITTLVSETDAPDVGPIERLCRSRIRIAGVRRRSISPPDGPKLRKGQTDRHESILGRRAAVVAASRRRLGARVKLAHIFSPVRIVVAGPNEGLVPASVRAESRDESAEPARGQVDARLWVLPGR
mmetsp:Transcript_44931/g.137210  ORF Transcript_44931/g.137210 Transcript_44931/m.137210 type:complete len:251 (-) Transcript_44931:1118-1870(-)